MSQVGQTLVLNAVFTNLPVGVEITYIWEFWDGTVAATVVPTVSKKINKGGDPADSRKLYYSVTAATSDGQSASTTGNVEVNWPPQVASNVSVSKNDSYFPYDSSIGLTAFDPENDSFDFRWYIDGTYSGAGISSYAGTIFGTYAGTVAPVSGTINEFSTTVEADQSVRLYLVDDQGGTSITNLKLVGNRPPSATIGLGALPTVSVSDYGLSNQRIGPGQSIDLVAYANQPGFDDFAFTWNFAGSNGWAATEYSAGTNTSLPSGGVRSFVQKSISGETAGAKQVEITAVNGTTGAVVRELIDVMLVSNQIGSSATVRAYKDGAELETGDAVAAGSVVEYRAVVADPDNDVVTYYWEFSQPSGVEPSTLRLWGPKASVDTTGYPSGSVITGTLIATDRYGAAYTGAIEIAVEIT